MMKMIETKFSQFFLICLTVSSSIYLASCSSSSLDSKAIYTRSEDEQPLTNDSLTDDSSLSNAPEDARPPRMENVLTTIKGNETEKLLFKGNLYVYNSLSEALSEPSKVVRLDLGGQQMRRLPQRILELNNLEELYLSDNQLSNLPDSMIFKLRKLRVLDLSNNNFQQVPAQVAKMSSLNYLNLSANRLSQLPNDFTSLSELKILDIRKNAFRELPQVVFNLNNLRFLYIQGISLSNFPADFSRLNRLQRLTLDACQLNEFPRDLLSLTALEHLVLSNNPMTSLPNDITKLSKLTHLDLKHNQIGDLSALYDLENLSNLDVSHNPVNNLSTNLFRRLPLRALDVSYTQITEIPPSVGQALNLVWLAAKGTAIIEIPTSIIECKRLKVLLLGGNPNLRLAEALNELGSLPQLNFLELSAMNAKNTPFTLPDEISGLKNLIILDLKGNRFQDIEKDLMKISSLPDLHALNLSKCGLRKAPQELQQFQRIEILGLDLQYWSNIERQKLNTLLPPQTKIVDGAEFFAYFDLALNRDRNPR